MVSLRQWGAEDVTLDSLKEILLTEISKVTSELKDLRTNFRGFDSRLLQIEKKKSSFV